MPKLRISFAAALCLAGSMAHAQTDTIFGAPGAMVMHNGAIYLSIAPQFQSFGMPQYNLGFSSATGATFIDTGAVVEHHKRINALGGNFGIGYVFAGLPPMYGNDPRIELAGLIVASSSQSDFETSRVQGGTQLVDGRVVDFGCNPCDWTSRLERDATHFRFNLMIGSDFPIGPGLFLTPSVGAFGGRTQIADSLFQTFATPGAAPGATSFYTADSTIRWWDFGGRVKAVITYQATPWLAVFVGGHADFARRHAEFDAADLYGVINAGSTMSGSATRFNVAAGGQFGIVLNHGNWLIVSLIGGVDYDTKVPRIQRQSTTSFAATLGTTQTPASLAFSGAVNYAAQLKVTLKIF